jgi:hypothetical protein
MKTPLFLLGSFLLIDRILYQNPGGLAEGRAANILIVHTLAKQPGLRCEFLLEV